MGGIRPAMAHTGQSGRRLTLPRFARAGGRARSRGGGALPGSRPSRSALSRGHSAWSPGSGSAGAAREGRKGAARPQPQPLAPGRPRKAYDSPAFLQSAAPPEGDPQAALQGPDVQRPLHREAPPAHLLAASLQRPALGGPPVADSALPGYAPSDPTRITGSPVSR